MADTNRNSSPLTSGNRGPGSWGVLRSAHVDSSGRVFPSNLPYVLAPGGCRRIVEGVDAALGAVDALRRHAEVAAAAGVYAPERRKAA